ncbi:GNAT family N-acetyltransferase [Blastopirellula sp. JC732]|uniref:GNAT family N-acetyltransferase n=1 Tax=Blastopirellula sediminis TaxID=2894196 RepID=A0A9X1SH23_9BACT|nr:GNAT family N-acetyltransferase [Blastopirellula sediminis]MCC9606720.1 GNAT family N-acetyltransferase [Blastopirellula sediminis]MCC9629983.1 GNAT family N-acetyltransferase [Blastopirellula sediminis]
MNNDASPWKTRVAGRPDRPACAKIFYASRRSAFFWMPNDKIRFDDFDQATDGEPIWVAERNRRIVGFVSWWPPENFIHNLFVAPEYQRMGVGRALLDACLAQIGRPARLKCSTANANALQFYERLGWRCEEQSTSPEGPYWLMMLDSASAEATT